MENQTNGQKRKRATRNKKDLRLRLVIQNMTEIAACVLHDLTAKIIRTPPVYRFVLQVQNNLIILNTTQS